MENYRKNKDRQTSRPTEKKRRKKKKKKRRIQAKKTGRWKGWPFTSTLCHQRTVIKCQPEGLTDGKDPRRQTDTHCRVPHWHRPPLPRPSPCTRIATATLTTFLTFALWTPLEKRTGHKTATWWAFVTGAANSAWWARIVPKLGRRQICLSGDFSGQTVQFSA